MTAVRSELEDDAMQHSQDQSAPRQPHVPQGYALVPQDRAGHGGGESAELFDWALIGSYAMFVLHSIRRHKLLFLLVWVGIISFSLALMVLLPKTYQVQTTLQAQRNIMPALGTPRAMDADAPTRLAAETIQRYDNLVAVLQQTEFVKKWPLHRAPLLRVKDFIWHILFKPPTREEQIDNFVYYLRDRLWVKTGDGTVTIGIEFPDKELAYRIVDTALQNFLEARHAADVSTIAEAITILEARTDQAHQTLASALQQLQTLRDARAAQKGRRVNKSVVEARAPAPLDAESSRLVVTIQGKRRAIADLEEFRRRRVTELQTKLQEQRATYSETHPAVLDTEQSLQAVRQESPQVAVLRRELGPLEAELRKRGLVDYAAQEVGRPTPATIPGENLDPVDPLVDEGPQIESAKGQVRFALTNYNQFLDRLEGARLELDSARAAFKYRYLLIIPAQRPRAPIKPKPALVLGASLIAGLALAVLSTTLVDLHSRKLLEVWQVERQLKLPLFGEVRSG
jgi:uncharacterized protein involved in exopolysaccharide biosynthesis